MDGKVVTANRLTDGAVVYLAPGGSWSGFLSEARVLAGVSEQTRLLKIAEQDVAQQIVVGPYLMAVERDETGPWPLSQRERIRASGPTIQASYQ